MHDAVPDAVIVGGGLIGLATAWRAAQRGLSVTVVDPRPGSATAHVAAGMLAPVSEATYTEEPLLRLGRASAEQYASFVAELESASGMQVGYRPEGTLKVAFDTDDLAVLEDLRQFQVSLGMRAERLTSRECRKLEPMLAPAVRGGVLVRDDHSVEPRRLGTALLRAATAAGVTVLRQRAARLLVRDTDTGGSRETEGPGTGTHAAYAAGPPDERAAGVRLDDGTDLAAGQVVLAAGCWSGQLEGVPDAAVPPVRPVKGQVLRLWTHHAFIRHSIRGIVRGSPIYAVPRADGEIVLGATTEELGHDTRVTAGGVWELLRDGHDLLPGITELELVETNVGLRPGSPDNAPLLGPTALPGLLVATGHHRNGVLLAPVSAAAMAEALATGAVPEVATAFEPRRFARHPSVDDSPPGRPNRRAAQP